MKRFLCWWRGKHDWKFLEANWGGTDLLYRCNRCGTTLFIPFDHDRYRLTAAIGNADAERWRRRPNRTEKNG